MPLALQITRRDLLDVCLVVAPVLAFAASWRLVSPDATSATRLAGFDGIHILCYVLAALLVAPLAARGRTGLVAAVGGAAAMVLLLVADLTSLRFFDARFIVLYSNLPVTAGSASLDVILATLNSYVPVFVWIAAVAAVVAALACAWFVRERRGARNAVMGAMLLAFAASLVTHRLAYRDEPVIAELVALPQGPVEKLRFADRRGNFTMVADELAQPRTIVMVVIESAGADVPSSDGRVPLRERLMEIGGTRGWTGFPHAVTNSNATNVSLPSLLTGSGAHEPAAKLHALPIVSQFAKARGYETGFITSSTMDWGGFADFVRGGLFDTMVTAEDTPEPFVNDLTVDDQFAYARAARMIGEAKGKLFVLLYVNALHLPFQSDSAFPVPASITERRARAAWITEAGFGLLFATMRKAGRLDDALVVVTADHGEFSDGASVLKPSARLQTLDEPILSPIMALKLPSSLPDSYRSAMRANAAQPVSNLDLAPTLADLLGARLRGRLAYEGSSLVRPVPPGRTIASTATSEWRQWPSTAIALTRDRARLVCDARRLCRRIDRNGAEAGPGDPLFDEALANPVLRRNLAQIHRDHLR